DSARLWPSIKGRGRPFLFCKFRGVFGPFFGDCVTFVPSPEGVQERVAELLPLEAGVDALDHPAVGVPHDFGDDARVHAGRTEPRGQGAPQVVRRDRLDTDATAGLLQAVVDSLPARE